MRVTLVLASALVAAGSPALALDQSIRLVPHRAVYELSLAKGGGSRGVEAARGRIAFDFTGNECEGYTLSYRQVTVLETAENGSKTSDLRTANFEAGDGKSFRFRNDSAREEAATETVDGTAEHGRNGLVTVRLREPRRGSLTLPEAVFPNEHMKRLIAAAQAGESTFSIRVFDGSDDGKKVYDTLAVIGKRIDPGKDDGLEPSARQEQLSALPRWPVSLSYFAPGEGERTPAYILSFELYPNGVSRALRLDYGDFALIGDMRQLQLLPEKACPR
jgi:hypothetical protein